MLSIYLQNLHQCICKKVILERVSEGTVNYVSLIITEMII